MRVEVFLVKIQDRASRVAIYVVAAKAGERARIEARRQELIRREASLGFDPGKNPSDLAELRGLLEAK